MAYGWMVEVCIALSTIRVVLLQTKRIGSIEGIAEHVLEMAERAIQLHAPDFLCLPEFFIIPSSFAEGAEEAYALTHDIAMELLKKISESMGWGYVVGGSIVERFGSRFYNTCHILHRGEVVASYSKRFPIEEELAKGVSPSREPLVLDVGGLKIGVLICADCLHREAVEQTVAGGAELVFLPISMSSQNHPPIEGHPLSQEYASKFGIVVAKTGCVGVGKSGRVLGAKSALVAPWGVVAEAASEVDAEVVYGEVSFSALREWRSRLGILSR